MDEKEKTTTTINVDAAKDDLRRTSYWLAEAQPVLSESVQMETPISTRPLSPHSQQPIRRKDLWPVQLEFENGNDEGNNENQKKHVICGLIGKPIRTQAAVAYWTTNRCYDQQQQPGRIVLYEDAFNQLIVGSGTDRKGSTDKKSSSSSSSSGLAGGGGSSSNNNKNDNDLVTKTTTTTTLLTNQKLYFPRTNQRIKHIRTLQRSGSSFATSGQATVVQKYRPTMT